MAFITLAVGNDEYLQRAAAFALSAKRFGHPTILMYANINPSRFANLFAKVVNIGHYSVINPGYLGIWELKVLSYEHSAEYDTCAFVDADSLVIRAPSEMFRLLDHQYIHTPGARVLHENQKWATPPGFTVREIARQLGVVDNAPLHSLNGGFLMWKRSPVAARWFVDFGRLFAEVHALYRSRPRLSWQISFFFAILEFLFEPCLVSVFTFYGPKSDTRPPIFRHKIRQEADFEGAVLAEI